MTKEIFHGTTGKAKSNHGTGKTIRTRAIIGSAIILIALGFIISQAHAQERERDRYGDDSEEYQIDFSRQFDNTPPTIRILSPPDNTIVPYSMSSINIIASATDNQDPNPLVSGDGMQALSVGANTITVTATDNSGNMAAQSIYVYREKYIDQNKGITLEEVSTHNTQNDCMIIINGNAYNITRILSFLADKDLQCGKDNTALYNVKYKGQIQLNPTNQGQPAATPPIRNIFHRILILLGFIKE